MGLLLWLCMASVRAVGWQLYPIGYLVVFFVSLVSKMLASNVVLSKASLNSSIWAIIFGFLLRNIIDWMGRKMPKSIKVAQQTELYIATSLVLLCIDIAVLRPLAPRALFVSWIDTPTLFMVVAILGWRILKIDKQTSIILSGATFICGSSAAIALGSSMGVPHKTQMPIAIISIFTIPSIIALPYIAKHLDMSPTVSGAWFGGCVDSTGGVIAAASIYGDKEAIDTSAVVKMMQNVLIGPLSVIVAWGWSKYELRMERRREEEELISSSEMGTYSPKGKKSEKVYVLLWRRFPKFVLGFIITAILFNTVLGDDAELRTNVNNYCFYVSEWFSTMSFVSIGLGLTINEMKRNIRDLGKLCSLYIVAQMVDIVVTALLSWIAFTFM
ncbi:hypothetical protein BX666DRAFT_2017199 [Dichotomocladium elegans]|nr:hypothetical protein BX666DRAFT_2017199 [Dichotomocladium elegans]